MKMYRVILVLLLLAIAPLCSEAFAQDMNLRPKYGLLPKNDVQKALDAKFLASIDDYYKGDRKKAAEDIASRGWQFLRQGNAADAMKRFNQAWLVDGSNGRALWGMAAIQAGSGKFDESLKLFAEAEPLVGDDVDLQADYARTLGIAGVQARSDAFMQEAFSRFGHVYEKAPQHTLNLQNWAITLFYAGDYAAAWEKLKVAEATPRHVELDQNFVAALQSKMPRP